MIRNLTFSEPTTDVLVRVWPGRDTRETYSFTKTMTSSQYQEKQIRLGDTFANEYIFGLCADLKNCNLSSITFQNIMFRGTFCNILDLLSGLPIEKLICLDCEKVSVEELGQVFSALPRIKFCIVDVLLVGAGDRKWLANIVNSLAGHVNFSCQVLDLIPIYMLKYSMDVYRTVFPKGLNC